MAELEELISEVKNRGEFDNLEIEFIHTRAKGILQLLNILDNKELPCPPKLADNGREVISNDEIQESKKEPELFKEPVAIKEEKVPGTEHSGNEDSEEVRIVKPVTGAAVDSHSMDIEIINGEEMLEESDEITDVKSRLGDSFLKAKSINDMITEQNKLEFKLSNRPLASIKAAIGINDRFQYIRELFDNDANKFSETVNILDSMKNEKEAADYLRHNFKWKKNETSLHFINLVKRRFHYE